MSPDLVIRSGRRREVEMPRKRHTAEQIINKLRQAEVELPRGVKIAQVCRNLEVTEQTYCRWRKEYGGVRTDTRRSV
jgi:hypothetical protein